MTIFSRLLSSKEIVAGIKQQEKVWPPPISFAPRTEKSKGKSKASKGHESDDEDDKTRYLTVKVKFSPNDPTSNEYDEKVYKFSDGTPEAFAKYRKQMDELFEKMNIDYDAAAQHRHYQATLKDKAKEAYTQSFNEHTSANVLKPVADRLTDTQILVLVINDTAKAFFPNWQTAARQQKSYMRTCLYMGDSEPKKFLKRIVQMNEMFKYFPFRDGYNVPAPLAEDELLDIADSSKKLEWHLTMLSQGKRPDTFETLLEAEEYYTQLYNADIMKRKFASSANDSDDDSPKKKKHKSAGRGDNADKKKKAVCKHCGRDNHRSEDCRTLPQNANKRPGFKFSPKQKEKTYTKDQTANMFTKVYESLKAKEKKEKAKNKRKVKFDDNEDSYMAALSLEAKKSKDDDSSSDSESDDDSTSSSDSNNS